MDYSAELGPEPLVIKEGATFKLGFAFSLLRPIMAGTKVQVNMMKKNKSSTNHFTYLPCPLDDRFPFIDQHLLDGTCTTEFQFLLESLPEEWCFVPSGCTLPLIPNRYVMSGEVTVPERKAMPSGLNLDGDIEVEIVFIQQNGIPFLTVEKTVHFQW